MLMKLVQMRRIILFILLLFTEILHSQNLQILGTVYDELHNGLPLVNVRIVDSDTTIIASATTDYDGSYSFSLIVDDQKQYSIIASHIGYDSNMVSINRNDSVIDINLRLSQYILDDIEVTSKKLLYENKDGKIIVNVQQIANSAVLNTAKILSQLPGVTASNKEGVMFNGQSATIYINGIEQRVSGKMAISLLESIPSSSIEQIELVSMNDGTSSVMGNGVKINLIMKNLKYDGYFARINGTLGWKEQPNNVFGGGGSFFYIIKKNKFLFNTSLSYKNDLYWYQSKENSIYHDCSLLFSRRINTNKVNVLTGVTNLSYELNNNHKINYNFFFYDDFANGYGDQIISRNNMITGIKHVKFGNDDLWTGNIEYTTPDTLKNSFIMSYGIMFGGIRAKTSQNNYDTLIRETDTYYLNSLQEMKGLQHDVKFDFKHIFNNNSSLKTGILINYGNLNDDVKYIESSYTGKYISSNFNGLEQNYEAYVNYITNVGNLLYLSTALRYVYVYQNFNYLSEKLKVINNYGFIFPYVSITDNKGIYKFSIGFTSKLIKPQYNTMLPGYRYDGDYVVLVGNPQVKPCTQYSIVFNQVILNAMFISMRYDRQNNLSDYILNNNSSAEIKMYEYKNYADANSLYFRISTPYRLIKDKITGNINFETTYYDLINFKNNYNPLENRGSSYWQFSVKGSINYTITKRLNAYIWFQYIPSIKKPHETINERWSMDAGISYQWGDSDRFVISIDAEDLFNTFVYDITDYYNEMVSNIFTKYNNRLIMLTFSIKFNRGEHVSNQAIDYNKNDTDRFQH